jgi:hypothetical protein
MHQRDGRIDFAGIEGTVGGPQDVLGVTQAEDDIQG